ncbi:polysaccharide deacetylase family protein [Uniformispora flossi]|uniref:polysaccharide deacetylase family protein n=1 Tax=Uniformispora flossi TaxID=3390723 RepID=UPI003C2B0AC4
MRLGVVGAVVAALLLAGCGDDNKPKPFGQNMPSAGAVPSGSSAPGNNTQAAPAPDDVQAAAARWGIKPFAAPPKPPAQKPVKANLSAPVVVRQVPTDQKIVFVTLDDGAEKDPKFLDMLKDLGVPVTMFLNDTYIKQNPDYFKKLQELGNTIQNHTVDHPNLKTLSAEAQKREICGDSDAIAAAYGKRPVLFRPPFGNYNDATLKAAGECGMGAIILWRESMQINDMQYDEGLKKLHPGDIILAHFRGPSELKGTTMTQMMANLFKKIQEQGFTIARLDDYV